MVDDDRNMLSLVNMPGEAQQIDRLMETLARHYADVNRGIEACTGGPNTSHGWDTICIIHNSIDSFIG